MKYKYGIGWKIFIPFSILMIVLTLVLGIAIFEFAKDMVTESATNQLRVLSITLTNQVQKDLGRLEDRIKDISKNSDLLKTLRIPAEDLGTESFLKGLPKTSQMISNLAVFNAAGKLIATTDYQWASLLSPTSPYFKKGLKDFYFGDVYDESDSGQKEQLVSTPIKESGKVIGVLVGQVDLSKIFDLMDQNLEIGKASEVFLVDAQLRFITSQHSDPLSLEPSHLRDTPLIKHLTDEFWVDMYQNYDEDEVLGTVRKIPEYNWYLVIERDYDSINDQVWGILRLIAYSAVGIIFVITFISFYLTKSITRPILSLVEAANAMSLGDFSHPVPNPAGNSYEITFLANEFENMRIKVASQQLTLKDRLEKSEMQLIQSERLAAIGALAASLAHEIRNPLNAMSLLMTQLELKLPKETGNQQIHHLRSEIKRLDQLVSGILDYAKPLQLQKTPVDVICVFH